MADEKCKDCPPSIEVKGLRTDVDNHREDIQDIYRRLSKVEGETASFKAEIKNLCKQIESLITTLRWTVGVVIAVSTIAVTILK